MARRARGPTDEEIQAEERRELGAALDYLDTPQGKALLKPKHTIHRWTGTTPDNIWIESAGGRQLFHSDEGESRAHCPVRLGFSLLRKHLIEHEAQGQHTVWRLDPAIVTLRAQRILDRTTPSATLPKKTLRI